MGSAATRLIPWGNLSVAHSSGKAPRVHPVIKGGIIVGASALAIWGISRLASKSRAAEKTEIDIESFKVVEPTPQTLKQFLKQLPNPKFVFSTDFRIKNPSNEELVSTKPYVKIFTVDSKGKEHFVAASPISDDKITIRPKGTFNVSVDIEARALNFPGSFSEPVKYFLSRFRGMPSTRKIKATYEFEALGLTLSDSETINI
jgi:hypothetical protein